MDFKPEIKYNRCYWANSFYLANLNVNQNTMDFSRNEITQQVRQTAKDFAIQYIKPHVMEWDESQEFPVHIFKELGNLV